MFLAITQCVSKCFPRVFDVVEQLTHTLKNKHHSCSLSLKLSGVLEDFEEVE